MVGPQDVQHASRCALAGRYQQEDPLPDAVEADTAQRRIGTLLASVHRPDTDLAQWLPVVITACAAVVTGLATLLFRERTIAGYVVIATALVLLQCSAALLTLHLLDVRRERRILDAVGPLPPELTGTLPTPEGPVQDPEWGLEGRVGTVLHLGDRHVPVLVADGPGRHLDPWLAARVGANLRLLEVRDGRAPEYGLVVHQDGAYRVSYDGVRDDVERLVRDLVTKGPGDRRDHQDRHRCITCPWRPRCPESLV